LPWKGYFDIIHDVDLFVFYDEVQYTKNDWRNRNLVYGKGGLEWLTLPCGYNIKRRIEDVKLNNKLGWNTKHFEQISRVYKNAAYYNEYMSFLEHIYLECEWEYLSELNQYTITKIASEFLGIHTKFAKSTDFTSVGSKSVKLLSILLSIGCDEYVSGSTAKGYIDEIAFAEKGITIIWKDYSGYPEYKQMRLPFENSVSIIDLLMNTGEDAPYYIWGWRGCSP
jgi:hypothetical protein